MDVTGVETDAEPFRPLAAVKDLAQLFKPAADLAALAGHGLQQHRRLLTVEHHLVERSGDPCDPGLHALSDMAARMEIVVVPRRKLQPPQVVRKRLHREFARFLLG